ncbi:hypothetical protein [Marinicauda pacifica]
MLREAYLRDFVPDHLYGQTQHKTLQARLSEDILLHRQNSAFVRTSPGRFFLRILQKDPNIPQEYKYEFPAPVRAEQLSNFRVLCVKREQLTHGASEIRKASDISSLLSESKHVHAKHLDIDRDLVQVCSLTVIYNCGRILLNSYPSSAFLGLGSGKSVGLVTRVKEDDLSLFDGTAYGVREAALRSIAETLSPPESVMLRLQDPTQTNLCGAIWLSNRPSYRSMIALIVMVNFGSEYDPSLRFGPVSGLRWVDSEQLNAESTNYEPWSNELIYKSSILKNRIFSGHAQKTERGWDA